MNIRLRLTDSETHKFIPTVRVTLEAKVGGKPITRFSRDGVFCPADGTPSLADKCTPKFSFLLDHKRDLDVYYWMPGVIDPTKIEITATATAASYPKAAKENVTVTATPNVAFFKQVQAQRQRHLQPQRPGADRLRDRLDRRRRLLLRRGEGPDQPRE